jgi:hypothetical protein
MTDGDSDYRSRGGIARREKLTPEQRSEIARGAARAKWDSTLPRATHEGDLRIGDVSIPCAVLEDGRRVLSQRGFLHALGRSRSMQGRQRDSGGDNMPPFLVAKNLKPYLSNELVVATKPIEFRTDRGAKALGYPAELLLKVCEVFLRARDANDLAHNQQHIAVKAEALIRALAKTGIVALVDEATGYQTVRPRDALQSYLEMILRRELAAWSKKFPDEFYANIYKIKGWPWPGMKINRYSVVAKYTRNLVYERLAPGVLAELEQRSPKDEKGRRKNKLHQWLNDDYGHPMLAQHLHALLMFQRLALQNGQTWSQFLKMVDQVMPKRGATIELPLTSSIGLPPPSSLAPGAL